MGGGLESIQGGALGSSVGQLKGDNRMPRAKRKKYSDTQSAKGKTYTGEMRDWNWKRRHATRKKLANKRARQAGLAFARLGGWLKLCQGDGGDHWQIYFAPGDQWDWWPTSAKLVHNQRWKEGVHCHTWQQVWRWIRDAYAIADAMLEARNE